MKSITSKIICIVLNCLVVYSSAEAMNNSLLFNGTNQTAGLNNETVFIGNLISILGICYCGLGIMVCGCRFANKMIPPQAHRGHDEELGFGLAMEELLPDNSKESSCQHSSDEALQDGK